MREQLIAEKKLQIQAELERWAVESAILSPGEQIRFSIRFERIPIVLEDQEDILRMPVNEFFTRKRFEDAGVARKQASYVSNWLISELRNEVRLADPQEKIRIATVSEFLQYSARIAYLRNLGAQRKDTKSWQYIHAVLKNAGLDIKK
jgi:hypothetical protein